MPSILIVDSTGNNRIKIDTKTNKLEIAVNGDISIKGNQNVEIEAGMALSLKAGMGFEATANLDAKITANTQLALEGMLNTGIRSGGAISISAPAIGLG